MKRKKETEVITIPLFTHFCWGTLNVSCSLPSQQLTWWKGWVFLTPKAAKIIPVPWTVRLTSPLKHLSAIEVIWYMNLSFPRHPRGFLPASVVNYSQIYGLRVWVKPQLWCSWTSRCLWVEALCWGSAEPSEWEPGLLCRSGYAADILEKGCSLVLLTGSLWSTKQKLAGERHPSYLALADIPSTCSPRWRLTLLALPTSPSSANTPVATTCLEALFKGGGMNDL